MAWAVAMAKFAGMVFANRCVSFLAQIGPIPLSQLEKSVRGKLQREQCLTSLQDLAFSPSDERRVVRDAVIDFSLLIT
jgi:hypothetical protein